MKQFWTMMGWMIWNRNWTLADVVVYGALMEAKAKGQSFWTFLILWALWITFSLWFQNKRDPELFGKLREEAKTS